MTVPFLKTFASMGRWVRTLDCMLCYVMLCYAMLCYAMFCYVMFCCVCMYVMYVRM